MLIAIQHLPCRKPPKKPSKSRRNRLRSFSANSRQSQPNSNHYFSSRTHAATRSGAQCFQSICALKSNASTSYARRRDRHYTGLLCRHLLLSKNFCNKICAFLTEQRHAPEYCFPQTWIKPQECAASSKSLNDG